MSHAATAEVRGPLVQENKPQSAAKPDFIEVIGYAPEGLAQGLLRLTGNESFAWSTAHVPAQGNKAAQTIAALNINTRAFAMKVEYQVVDPEQVVKFAEQLPAQHRASLIAGFHSIQGKLTDNGKSISEVLENLSPREKPMSNVVSIGQGHRRTNLGPMLV